MRKLIFLFGLISGHSIFSDESYDYNDTEDICDHSRREPIYKNGAKVCNQYKYCENGEYVVGTCPQGQYFDIVIANCYLTSSLPCGVPCAAACGEAPGGQQMSPPEATGSVDDRCNAYPTGVSPKSEIPGTCADYSYCSHGKFHRGSCPEGQYFDNVIADCYYTSSLPCGVPCAAACASTTQPPIVTIGGDKVDPQCTNHPTGISQRFALYGAHEQLCNSFGFCKHGKYYEDDCIPGQYFDIAHEGCLPINNLPCGQPCSNPCHPMCTNYPTGVSPRHQVIIDGKLSCNSFGYCKDGDHIVEDCTPGQYFDGGPGACFPIDDIPCGTPCSNPCTTQPVTTTKPVSPISVDPECKDHPEGVSRRHQVTIDNEISCTSFGYCIDGKHIIEECTPGQYFDGGPGACFLIDEIPCGTPCSNPCKPVHPMCVNFPTGVSPRVASQDGDSCTDFDYCLDGDFISESCTPGQYFDAAIRGCLPIDDLPCGSPCSNPCPVDPRCVGRLEGLTSAVNCTHFDICLDNEYHTMACDGHLVYDTTLGVCVDGNTIPIGSPCTTQVVIINDKKVIKALEGQVQCEANYVATRLVSVVEELLLQGQKSCRTDWTKFGFIDGTLTGDYKDYEAGLREETRERFEMMINSPLIVAELEKALMGLSLDHRYIMGNATEMLDILLG